MNNLNVSTSQNVKISYQLASIGDRMAAYFIDSVIITLYYIFAGVLYFVLADIFRSEDVFASGNSFFAIFFFLLLISPAVFYHLLCEYLMNGKSFGKKAMKIKVAKVDGSQPNFGNYFIRWIVGIIDALPYWSVGIVSIVATKKSQRVGDIAAGTVVIKLNQKVQTADTVFTQIDANHTVKYHNALLLSDKDVELVKTIMQKSESKNKRLLHNLAQKINEVILANETDINPRPFLNQVLKDYNYLCIKDSEM